VDGLIRQQQGDLEMRARIRCLTAVLLVLACSGAAFGQSDLGQWGNNVQVTCVLTRGQALATLFSNNLLVSDMVQQWRQNFGTTPPAVPEALEIQSALNVLVRTFAMDSRMNWTAQDLIVRKWADLPGNLTNKKKIRAAFEILKADGLMCLPFLNRAENEVAPQALVTTMFSVLGNPELSILTHWDLYTTAASGDQYSEEDMDLLIYAMDDVQLIRTEAPERVTTQAISLNMSQVSGMGMSTSITGFACCDRTTRSCLAGGTSGRCSQCGSTCCLGSSWCP
jgi:hypothetical protein